MRSTDRVRGRMRAREKRESEKPYTSSIKQSVFLTLFCFIFEDQRKNIVADKRIQTHKIHLYLYMNAPREEDLRIQPAIQNENKSHDEQKDHLKYDLKSKVTSNDF